MPVYERFQARTHWGDAGVLRAIIKAADAWAVEGEAGSETTLAGLAEDLDAVVPHGDDFDDPETTGAQDAAIESDAALRVARGLPTEGLFWYALEHLDQKVTESRTGFTDLGSGPDGERWEVEILAEPEIAAALDGVERCLARLEGDGIAASTAGELLLWLRTLDRSATILPTTTCAFYRRRTGQATAQIFSSPGMP